MNKLFRLTPLQDNFNCNFNVLINGTPRVMGVYEILNEWTVFRRNCVKRRVAFDLKKKKEKLHLLNGLKKILLDIDYAIKLIRETDEESEVVPNLMIGFGIDEVQAEYVAEIKRATSTANISSSAPRRPPTLKRRLPTWRISSAMKTASTS